MKILSERLRALAKELKLTDAEVARRAGLSERRYGHYAKGDREPDLATLVRIATVLKSTPNDLLGWGDFKKETSSADILKRRLAASADIIPASKLETLVVQAEALAHTRKKTSPKA